MSATCDFYIECAEQGIFPLESDKPRPAGVTLRQFTTSDYMGQPMVVTGISTADALAWWNAKHDREVPAPVGLPVLLRPPAREWHPGGWSGWRASPVYLRLDGDGEILTTDSPPARCRRAWTRGNYEPPSGGRRGCDGEDRRREEADGVEG